MRVPAAARHGVRSAQAAAERFTRGLVQPVSSAASNQWVQRSIILINATDGEDSAATDRLRGPRLVGTRLSQIHAAVKKYLFNSNTPEIL